MKKFYFFLTLQALFAGSSLAQTEVKSDAFLDLYKNQLPYFQELISGGQYADLPRNIDGDPYYKSRNFDYGVLKINGIDYQEVPLLYDSYKDYLVTFHPIFNQKILMKSEKIDEFVLFGEDQFQVFGENKGYPHHGNGFYRVLSDGDVKVLVKYYKELKVSKDMTTYLKHMVSYEDYFLWFEGDFVKINRKKEAIQALGLEKKAVKRALPRSNYEFKKDVTGYLQELVAYRASSMGAFKGFSQ